LDNLGWNKEVNLTLQFLNVKIPPLGFPRACDEIWVRMKPKCKDTIPLTAELSTQ
jgi:hypothetical protein